MTEKAIKKMKVVFETINLAYTIAGIFGGMTEDKKRTQNSLTDVLYRLYAEPFNGDLLNARLEDYQKSLENEINNMPKSPTFAQGGVVPKEN